MANKKGIPIEPGIWRQPDGVGYLAEVNYTDPHTGRRVREQKGVHRLDLAREWRQTRKADALRGEVHRRKDQPRPMRFEQLADEYLENWSRVEKRESTYHRDQLSVQWLKEAFGKKLLSEITRRDVEKYLAQRKEAGKAPATLNRELCCMKNMLRKAVDWGYMKTNPAWGVKQQREALKEFEFLTEVEMDQVIENCAPHLRAIVTLAIHTGMRRGEIFKLEWRDLDFKNGFITVRDSKNGDTRHIPMNTTVRQAMERQTTRLLDGKICPLVFSNDAGQMVTDVKKGFSGALKRAGIERHIRFHDLRHTFASHLVMKGIDLRTVAKLLGHRDIKMTMRYSHLGADHLQAAVEVMTQRTPQRQGQQEAVGSP